MALLMSYMLKPSQRRTLLRPSYEQVINKSTNQQIKQIKQLVKLSEVFMDFSYFEITSFLCCVTIMYCFVVSRLYFFFQIYDYVYRVYIYIYIYINVSIDLDTETPISCVEFKNN